AGRRCYLTLSAAVPGCAFSKFHTPGATRSHRGLRLLFVGMRAPAVPPITDPAAAPRPRPRMAPPAAPPATPIAVFLARRLPRLRVFRGFVLLEVVAALATGTTPSAKSPTDIRAARMDFLITKLLTNLRRKTVAKALLFRHTLDRTRKLSVACG